MKHAFSHIHIMPSQGASLDVLEITEQLSIPMSEIEMSAVRSRGAGGQNVNKVATAIHLRFDIGRSSTLPPALRNRLLASGDQRISSDGVLVIKSQQYRSQDRNRQAALQRLRGLLLDAMTTRKKRIPSRPGKKAIQKRLDEKSRRSALKRSRSKALDD